MTFLKPDIQPLEKPFAIPLPTTPPKEKKVFEDVESVSAAAFGEYVPQEILKPKIFQIFESMDLTVDPKISSTERHKLFAQKWQDIIWTNVLGIDISRRIFGERWSDRLKIWVERDEYSEVNIQEFFRSRLKLLFDSWNNQNTFKYRIRPIDFLQQVKQTYVGFILPSAESFSLDDNDISLRMAGIDPNSLGKPTRSRYEKLFNGQKYTTFYQTYEVWAHIYSMKGLELPNLIPEDVIERDDQSVVHASVYAEDRRIEQTVEVVSGPQMYNSMLHQQEAEDIREVANELFNSVEPGLLPTEDDAEAQRGDVEVEEASRSDREQKADSIGGMDDIDSLGSGMDRPDFVEQSESEIAGLETHPAQSWLDSAARVQSTTIFEEKASWSFYLSIFMLVIICWALITRRRN